MSDLYNSTSFEILPHEWFFMGKKFYLQSFLHDCLEDTTITKHSQNYHPKSLDKNTVLAYSGLAVPFPIQDVKMHRCTMGEGQECARKHNVQSLQNTTSMTCLLYTSRCV